MFNCFTCFLEIVLGELMEAEACGHVYMHPIQRLEATEEAVQSITIDDIGSVARELCEHLSDIDPVKNVRPAAIVACAPLIDRQSQPFQVTEDEVLLVLLSLHNILLAFPSLVSGLENCR